MGTPSRRAAGQHRARCSAPTYLTGRGLGDASRAGARRASAGVLVTIICPWPPPHPPHTTAHSGSVSTARYITANGKVQTPTASGMRHTAYVCRHWHT